ncbi:MAG: putative MAP kinase kinase family domain protein [Streblomastix strix]|uniref:Putative MAP kinase kinase family domain protein n=1 Tax=Streblomastix strix TaxID=222440 RepID=A0A5J4VZM7_9EUKA|nr:MAG: putative MAP kinase kinase family domain protein [Streblomastix strix]
MFIGFQQNSQIDQQVNNSKALSQSSSSFDFHFITSWKKSDFDRKERLGKGAFDVVRHVIERITQFHAAWKEVNYETPEEIQFVNREIGIMNKIYGIEEGKAYIVLEYCSKGDLRQYIDNMRESGTMISPQKCFEIIGELASSIFQLHSNGILHADLKPENVLLVEGFKVKLADFGLARQLQVGREYTTNHGGTFLFKAPEILRNKKRQEVSQQRLFRTTAADIWAFGVTIFELASQHHPFFDKKSEADLSIEEYIHRVVDLPPAELPENFPLNLRNLVKQMLEKNPQKRISAKEILQVPEIAATLTQK